MISQINNIPLVGLPKTGIAASLDAGDDGALQYGIPGVRFVDLGNGTIADRHTGLQWVKTPELMIPGAVGIHATNQIQAAKGTWSGATGYVKGDLVVGDGSPDALFYVCVADNTNQEPPNAAYWRETIWTASAANLTTPATKNYATALAACSNLEYAGFTDWRLPNIAELSSILLFGSATAVAINALFVNTIADVYWSSTPRATSGTTYGLVVAFARLCYMSSDAKSAAHYIRPVRGGIQ